MSILKPDRFFFQHRQAMAAFAFAVSLFVGFFVSFFVSVFFNSGFTTLTISSARAGISSALDQHQHFSFLSDVISYPEDQSKSGITVLETVLLMNEVETMWRSDVQSVSAGFQWDFHWDKPWLGAGTTFSDERIFKLMLWGGLVRAEKMTLEGLEAVLCHEFGHLLGGTPRQIFPGQTSSFVEHWSSTDGKSDWWAATVCLPRLYGARGLSPVEIRDRTQKAGLDFVRFAHFHFEKSAPLPSLFLDAPEAPLQTLTLAYPTLQCRLDTFRLGAKLTLESALESSPVTTPEGSPQKRPRCWFAD
jgi:hypothetical protein